MTRRRRARRLAVPPFSGRGRTPILEDPMADDASVQLSPTVPRPAHIPDSVVYDFDFFYDPGLLADPHTRVLDLLDKAPPIFWIPRQGGHWMAIGHEANFEISRSWELFSNEIIPQSMVKAALAMLPPGAPHFPQPIPINLDPPAHGAFRLPLNGVFSPRAMKGLQESVRSLAIQLIEAVKREGRCEFMTAVAEPLPVQVFLKLMGLPLERQPEYRALVRKQLAEISSGAPAAAGTGMQTIAAAMRDVFLERQKNPQDDLISLLWRTEVDGQPMTMDRMEDYGVLLFIAGLDTVMNGIGFGVRHLAQNPELQASLRAKPELIPEAMEELLRRYTFTVPPRRVAKDQVFMGVEMKENERLMLFLPGADLDARHWKQPGQFDLDRDDKVHMAFNSGPHRCVGSHLARVELQILYEELLARLPMFRLDPDKPPTFHGGAVLGVDTLDLLWDA
jgi:cytochrome P450